MKKNIPWWEPKIGSYEHRLVRSVLVSNFPNEGKLTEEFENKLSMLLEVKHALTVTSATAALYLSLKALDIGFGDEVIVPDISFVATANAVEMTGAKAILADVDPDSLTISIESVMNNMSTKTKAVIPVHVSGRGADVASLISIAKKAKIHIVEDAAEALFSKHSGKFLGTHGITGCFSLSPAKTITTGQGGLIITNNSEVYKKLKELKDQGRRQRGTGGDDIHYSVGYNFKFTDLQAAIGLGQLHYINRRIRRLKKTYVIYKKLLRDIGEISLFNFNIKEGEQPQWIDARANRRDELLNFLSKQGIDCRRFWLPIHQQIPYKRDDTHFPNSTLLSKQSFWLPSAYTLTDADIKTVCKKIADFYSHE